MRELTDNELLEQERRADMRSEAIEMLSCQKEERFWDDVRAGFPRLEAIEDHGEFVKAVIEMVAKAGKYKRLNSDYEVVQDQLARARVLHDNLWELISDELYEAGKRGDL